MSAQVDLEVASVGSRLVAYPLVEGGVGARCAAKELRQAGVVSRLTAREVLVAEVLSRCDARERVTASVGGRHHSMVAPGWSLWARDSATGSESSLGWIPAEATQKELADIPLADGTYEVEVRPSEIFWEGGRGRSKMPLVIENGNSKAGLPAIQDLASSVSLGITTITWKVPAGLAGGFQFGLWFGPTSPVSTSGPPDKMVPFYPGVGEYKATRSQVGSEFVVLAAFSGAETGSLAELYLPWTPGSIQSPSDQGME